MLAYGFKISRHRFKCPYKNCTTCRPKIIKKAAERRKNKVDVKNY